MNELTQSTPQAISCGFDTEAGFALLQRQAQLFSSSSLVPTVYQKNIANCAIALEMAFRMKASPLMVMQNLYIVHGTPSWSAKFLIATINTCGRYSSLDYEVLGDDPRSPDYKIRAYAIERETQRRLNGEWIDWKMVSEEGWNTDKKNAQTGKVTKSKWNTLPGQMFRYRAAAFWQRAYCPEIGMGLLTVEEAEDIPRYEREVRDTPDQSMEKLRLASANKSITDRIVEHSVYAQPSEMAVDKQTGELLDDEIERLKNEQLAKQYKEASGG